MANRADVIKPIQLANEWKVRPQYVYALIREGKLQSHTCTCGHKYLLKSEVAEYVAAKKAAK